MNLRIPLLICFHTILSYVETLSTMRMSDIDELDLKESTMVAGTKPFSQLSCVGDRGLCQQYAPSSVSYAGDYVWISLEDPRRSNG